MRRHQISEPRISLLTRHARFSVLALVAIALPLVLAAPSTSAPAKSKLTVSGKLDRAGYTVLAVGYGGKVTSTSKRSFKLRLAEKRVTLQLVNSRGKYAGPIVVGYAKGKAIVGVRAGARLGTIKVLPSKGYARVAKKVRSKWLDAKRTALVRKQVPLGNGRNFGFVKSSRHNGPSGAGNDTDYDGVPNVLDSATTGYRVLNALSTGKSSSASSARSLFTPLADVFGLSAESTVAFNNPSEPTSRWMSQIFLNIQHTLNADAAGVTREQIDETLVANLNLKLLDVPTGDTVKLDCNGLSYCTLGGTGRMVTNGVFSSPGSDGPPSESEPWPSCCSSGGDGFGVLRGTNGAHLDGTEFSLDPHAVSTKIGTGDTMTVLITKGGTTTLLPLPLNFVFNTVPALKSYTDSNGNAVTIDYSDPAGAYGTQSNPAPVTVGADGHLKVQLTWWRPQRTGIAGAGEPDFMDIGGLVYEFGMQPQGTLIPARTNNDSGSCSAASYTNSDSNLTVVPQQQSSGIESGELTDGSADRATDSANTLSVTLDITKCVVDKNGSANIPVGTEISMDLSANTQNSNDHANQDLNFKVVS